MSQVPNTSVNGCHGNYTIAGSPFATGGVAQLYRCTSDPTLVFKKYKRSLTDTIEIANVEGLVATGHEVLKVRALVPGSTPESSVCWPLDIIRAGTSSSNVAGVVLPAIPAKFFNANGDPRGLDFLILARANPPAAATRVAVLLRLAEILAWLAGRGLVHADISAKNVVWSGSGSGNAFLIDADGLRPSIQTPRSSVATPGWTDPRLVAGKISAHDKYSDWYALALAIYRGLFLNLGNLDRRTDETWPAPSAIPRQVPPSLRRCIEKTLGNPLDPLQWTTPAEWVRTLLDVFVSNGAYNIQTLRVLEDHATQYRNRYQRPAQPPPRVAQIATRATGSSLGPATPTPIRTPTPGSPNRRWGKALIIGLIVLILVVAVVVIIMRNVGEDDPAEFTSVAVSPSGELYIADDAAGSVWKLKTGGVRELVAGDGSGNYNDFKVANSAVDTQLDGVESLAFDTDGILFISTHSRVLRLTPEGKLVTVAGGGSTQPKPGLHIPATEAGPVGGSIAIDQFDTLYVSDWYNRYVYRVSVDGMFGIVAGNGQEGSTGDGGPATQAAMRPHGVAVDPAEVLHLMDRDGGGGPEGKDGQGGSVRRVGPDGIITTIAGANVAGGPVSPGARATQTQLGYQNALAIDPSGNIFVGGDRLFRVDPQGGISELNYTGTFILDLATGPSGELYVASGDGLVRFNVDGSQTQLCAENICK